MAGPRCCAAADDQQVVPTGLRNVMAITAGEERSLALYSVNPKPFTITDSEMDPVEGLWFLVQGEADQSYQIQVSEDVVNWFSVLEAYATTGYFWVNDDTALDYPITYYRAMAQNFPMFAP
jgi:hypothetical protein